MLLTAIFFTVFALTICLGFINPIIEQVKISNNYWGVKNSYYLAESGIEDLIYRSKNNMLSDEGEVFLVNADFVSIYASGTEKNILISEYNNAEYSKKLKAEVQKEAEEQPFEILDWRIILN